MISDHSRLTFFNDRLVSVSMRSRDTGGQTMSSKQIATHYLPDSLVAERYSVSPRTIDRWDDTPDLGFPPPIYIRGRKYRDEES
jgi:hypothetical protein